MQLQFKVGITVSEKFLKELRVRLVHQFLDIIILLFLTKPSKAKYPTGISIFCESMFGVKINPDSLYGLLLTLERKGLIKGETKQIIESRTIRTYTLTENGQKLIEDFLKTHEEMMTFIRYMFENQEEHPSRQKRLGNTEW
jgi:DNA-binding PadR family transcriptional regulator